MRMLVRTVAVRDPSTQQVQSCLAGMSEADLPLWAVEQITNDAAWGNEPDAAPTDPPVEPPSVVDDPELAADLAALRNPKDEDAVRAWLAGATIKRIVAAVDALDEQERSAIAYALVLFEHDRGGDARSSLVDKLSSYRS